MLYQSPEEVARALEEVLARPEFTPPPPSPFWDWLRGVLGDLFAFLRNLLPGLSLGEGARGVVFLVVVSVLALGGVLLMAVLLHRIAGRQGRTKARGAMTSRRVDTAPAPESAEGWEARARALAAAGRWREAAAALYQVVLHRLAARGAVRLDPAKTPGDYRRESRRDAEAFRSLDSFLRRFEPLFFGGREVDAAAFERLSELAGIGGGRVG